MPHMGYCRFQNTLLDLRDCQYHLDDDTLSKDEEMAREQLIQVCRDIIEIEDERE